MAIARRPSRKLVLGFETSWTPQTPRETLASTQAHTHSHSNILLDFLAHFSTISTNDRGRMSHHHHWASSRLAEGRGGGYRDRNWRRQRWRAFLVCRAVSAAPSWTLYVGLASAIIKDPVQKRRAIEKSIWLVLSLTKRERANTVGEMKTTKRQKRRRRPNRKRRQKKKIGEKWCEQPLM